MSQRIVNLFEIVQIETDHRELGPPARQGDGLFHAFTKEHPVRQFGQRVVACHERDACLSLLALGDVLVRRDPSTTGHGLEVDGDNSVSTQLLNKLGWLLGGGEMLPPEKVIGHRHGGYASSSVSIADDLLQRATNTDRLRRKVVNLDPAAIP